MIKFIQKYIFCFLLIFLLGLSVCLNAAVSSSAFQSRTLTPCEFEEMINRLPATSFQKDVAHHFLEDTWYAWSNGVHLHTIQNSSGWYDGTHESDYMEFPWIWGAWQAYGTHTEKYDRNCMGNGSRVWLAPMTIEEMEKFPHMHGYGAYPYEFTHWIIIENGTIAFPAYNREEEWRFDD